MKTSVPKVIGIMAIIVAAAMLIGCASSSPNTMASKYESQLNEKNKMIDTLKSEGKEKDKIIDVYKKELRISNESAASAEQRAREAEASRTAMKASDSGSSLFPPGAKSGECWARVFIAPTYRTSSERVLKHGESEQLEIIPAQYEWVEEKVLVKPESKQLVEVPAKYEMQQERVLVKEAHTVWKKGRGPIEKIDHATGEIMCLVEVPASYKTVTKKVMVSPPTTKELFIPAEYKTVKVRKMISAAQERKISIPAEYQTITRTEIASEGHMEWRRILCETNVNSSIIKEVQMTLRNAGHDPGRIDGVIGRHTQSALKSYQRANSLGEGGLTYETLRHMNISL